ncbi:hypothetical protein [Anaerophilus nitritogenes]|uniref:hypothetical protein n=1 Tax=Anaerophilus nitritogenes TaxID=2498136 RepID=UPI00101DB0C8|nr:hypothetical protein [Anaerophilus nitritogenes]
MEIRNLLFKYLETRNQEVLVKLYEILAEKLYISLEHPVKYLTDNLRSQKYSIFAKRTEILEKRIDRLQKKADKLKKTISKSKQIKSENNIKQKIKTCYLMINGYSNLLEKKISNEIFFELSLKDYMKEVLLVDEINFDYDLFVLYPSFYRILNKFTVDMVNNEMNTWQIVTYEYYILNKFTLEYWEYLRKKFVQYYQSLKYNNIQIEYYDDHAQENPHYFDEISYENNECLDIEDAYFQDEEDKTLQKYKLSTQQDTIFHTLIEIRHDIKFKDKEISKETGIPITTVHTQINKIRKKILDYKKSTTNKKIS